MAARIFLIRGMKALNRNLLARFLIWRARHIPQRQFILFLSVVVGFVTGMVAVFLKNSTHMIQELVTSGYLTQLYNPYYFIFPIIGILITVLIRKVLKEKVGEGIPSALFAISRKGGILSPFKMYGWVVTSIFTVGFGGSVGLEGPTVGTGSAIGSNIGRIMHLNYKSRILLMGCAATGAIASIFNAPIAAIIFTIEIFSLDLTFGSLIPLLLSSAAGAITTMFMQGNDYLLHYRYIVPYQVGDIPFYLLLGVGTAFISIYFNKVFIFLDHKFNSLKSWPVRIFIGGGLLGALIFLLPPLYGEGYETVNLLLSGRVREVAQSSFIENYSSSEYSILMFLGLLLFLKVIASSLTMGAGGVGGVFAPALFTGSVFGFGFSRFINDLHFIELSTSNFALVGMAGLMAGVLHAPLTAVFMIAEITGGYELFVPLMLVSAISFLVTRHFMPHSIYTVQLARKGDLLTHDKDHAVLTLLSTKNVIEKNFTIVRPEMSFRKLLEAVTHSKRNIFPVVDSKEKLVGILTLDDFRSFMFDESLYDIIVVAELMNRPPEVIQINDDMSTVMQKFQKTGAWNLPVVDAGKYIGFISKSKLFSAYRRKLIEFTA